jgi:hypothetical protein
LTCWEDADVCFVLDQEAELDFFRSTFPKTYVTLVNFGNDV